MTDLNRLFRIDFYPQDWLTQTGRMTVEQRGVFIQIVALIYSNRGAIENDPSWIARASNCSTRLARAIIDQLIASGDLSVEGSKLTQKRCERELKAHRNRLEHSSKGGRNKAENERKSKENKDITSSDHNNSLAAPSYPIPSQQDKADALSLEKPDLLSPVETPNTETPKEPANAKPRKPKPQLIPLPDDWRPHDNHRAKCKTLGHDPDALAEQFRNHHIARATKFASWDAAFFTWIGNASRFGGGRPGSPTFGRNEPRDITGAALRVAARYQNS